MELKNKDIIVFGLQSWDIPLGSNCKNIAMVMAQKNRVLYVNRPLDRATYFHKKKTIQTKARINFLKNKEKNLKEVFTNLYVFNPSIILESINFLPAGFIYDFLIKRNGKLLSNEIIKACTTLNFKNCILFVDNDFFNGLYLKEYLKPDFFIYYIRDYLRSQNYFKKHGNYAEPSLIKKADVVATNSSYLAEYAHEFNAKVLDIGQGCDVEEYLKAPDILPRDVAAIPRPIIGYCGTLTDTRIDINLIFDLAKLKTNWHFVFVGPEDEVFKKSALHQLKNVHFLGSKKQEELPGYVHSFDVCINPQLLNQMTIGNYPRKVDEYLATGKPVVATKTKTMEMFSEYCYLGSNVIDYENNINKALAESKNDMVTNNRITFSKSHTWQASVNKLYNLVNRNLVWKNK